VGAALYNTRRSAGAFDTKGQQQITKMALAYRVVVLQLAVGMAVAGVLLTWSWKQALGALLAAATCALPNGYFAWRAQSERSPSRVLGAGVAKFYSTIGLMVLVFWWWQPAPLGFLGVLVLMQVTHAVAGGWLTV
jgi:F0F1-type ATP synthase assembly protein I